MRDRTASVAVTLLAPALAIPLLSYVGGILTLNLTPAILLIVFIALVRNT